MHHQALSTAAGGHPTPAWVGLVVTGSIGERETTACTYCTQLVFVRSLACLFGYAAEREEATQLQPAGRTATRSVHRPSGTMGICVAGHFPLRGGVLVPLGRSNCGRRMGSLPRRIAFAKVSLGYVSERAALLPDLVSTTMRSRNH